MISIYAAVVMVASKKMGPIMRRRDIPRRCSVSQQLSALQTHTKDTFLFISHTTNVLMFKFRCNIFIGVRIIKEMPVSVASGTTGIIIGGVGEIQIFCKLDRRRVHIATRCTLNGLGWLPQTCLWLHQSCYSLNQLKRR